MAVTHINRNRVTYYLHAGTTKTGKPRYWFSTKTDGDLVDTIPDGYEIYENPDSQVFLRKIVPQLIDTAEVAAVEDGLKRYAPGQNCIVNVEKEHIVIYHAEGMNLDLTGFGFGLTKLPTLHHRYSKVIRFTLVDKKQRTFRVQRWCFKGSIDDWISLLGSPNIGKLVDLLERVCPHIGQESFFELM